ncbi:MAG: ATP synthase F1 subunit epsilon [Firmicutes bacterium]|nr:ATP synthase F1 subunit epsilon [Bacillota bacterium]
MGKTFKLDIVTPDRKFFSGESEMVVVKTPEGEIGVMGGHLPMVAAITTGPIKMLVDGKWLTAFLSEGFMSVKRDGTVVLVDTAKWPHEIKTSD